MSRSREPEKQSVTVQIAGQPHVLKSDAAPDYTRAVAAHVDTTMRALSPGNALDPQRVAILAALVVTDELFRAREELRALREEVARRAATLADRLEDATAETRG